ncbi:uncharacterized protein LOC125241731 isoform X2 [Leguminivora glycinivorella]|uniref:uncharacterized protein LOC125241731 isoform X2 n=1 Tax=Leguminivora glycinivorella TaxID=1035111 RepID=UPI00200C80C5|nr:uncharacterized protein LOC125241731 isoform X2 [Leguminivora glycinivorella]
MSNMEVDGADSSNSCSNIPEGGKYANSKAFVDAARQYETTHSEASVSLMNRYLNLLASTCDLSIFAPGRSEVCALFSSLWRVMREPGGPQWAGVAVLARACMEPSARHALTHTYKFMPILTQLLSNSISNDKKIKLLTVMQDVSYGIVISWQESYLPVLMKQLTDWISSPCNDTQDQLIRHRCLSVMANICSGNLPAVYALMRTIDAQKFVAHLMSLKDSWYGGAGVCRLLLCLSAATRGAGAVRQSDVNSYLSCCVLTFSKAVAAKDSSQLLQAYTLMNELCQDINLRNLVVSAPDFCIEDTLKNLVEFCNTPNEALEPEQVTAVVQNALKFLAVLVNLDMYPFRKSHCQMLCLCLVAHRLCLPESLELFSSIICQYKDEGQLPEELILMISEGLPGLLVPPALEPGKAGLQWLQVVGALCETGSTQERVLRAVSPDAYEEILHSVLHYSSQNGSVGQEQAQQAAVLGCRTALTLAPLLQAWAATLKRLLLNNQVRKMLSAGLRNGTRRLEILKMIRHHLFPCDLMDEVFEESPKQAADGCTSPRAAEADEAWQAAPRLAPGQEHAVDALVRQLGEALHKNMISDIATSSVMELYGYKMACLEQRLHSQTVALQGASEHMASLQHSLAMLQATNSSQQDVLYTTQMQNEKLKKTIDNLHKQLEDAESAVRGYRSKVASEKARQEKQKEILQNEFKTQLTTLENGMKTIEKEHQEKLKTVEQETKAVQKLLDQETSKCNELAAVLIRFEEQVQAQVKEIEEANALERSLRKEIELKELTIKHQEKTILERENRLYQLNTHLEEMKRVQEMVAKIMSKSASTAASPNNST